MKTRISQEEINQILLQKELGDFYLAIVENRTHILTDEEYEEILERDKTIWGDNKDKVEDFFKKIETDASLPDFARNILKRITYSLAQIRQLAILTMIDDDIYDIANNKFVDLRTNQIIHFDNLTTLYDETNARIKLFTPNEEKTLKHPRVLIDVDDESPIRNYENIYSKKNGSEDLTARFLEEVSKEKIKKLIKK